MKVLWLTNGYPTEEHPEYCAFTKDQIEDVKSEGVNGDIYFINAREKGKIEYIRALFKLRSFVNDYDLTHCFHGLTFLLVLLLRPNVPILVSFLNSIDNEYSQERSFWGRWLSVFTKKILDKKREVGVILKDKIPAHLNDRDLTYHLPNGVNLDKFHPIDKEKAKERLGLNKSSNYILFVSSKNLYRRQKRYDRFKETIKLLKQDDSLEKIEPLTISTVPREELIYYYNACEIHLLTSDFEGSPNSVKESLACNLPVVSTNVGNVKSMLEGVPRCYVSDSNDPRNLASLVRKSLLSSNGKMRYYLKKKKLDSQSKGIELKNIYEELLAKFK